MDGKQIGIKLADGSFYPVLAEEQPARRKLVLTTARDNQETVQIDLFRGEGELAEESQYVGSLMIENIQPAPMKEPEIEVVLGVDELGNLEATATDALSGDSQSLSISLDSLTEGGAAAEFELEGEGAAAADRGKSDELEESLLTGETYPLSATDRRKDHLKKKRRSPLLLIGFVILSLILIVAIAFVVFRAIDGRPIPPLFGGQVQPVAETAAAKPAASSAAAAEPALAEPAQAGPAASPAAAAAEPAQAEPAQPAKPAVPAGQAASPAKTESTGGGVWYNIKWGDTLWDISATYYRNPWLYPKIAKANSIVNPDLIFAGRKLFIPEN